MLYAIIGHEAPDGLEKRKKVRVEHLSRIQAMVDDGRIVAAGPMPAIDSPDPGPAGFSGSLIIAEFDCLEDARAWINADPYVTHGVFESVDVRPFNKTVP